MTEIGFIDNRRIRLLIYKNRRNKEELYYADNRDEYKIMWTQINKLIKDYNMPFKSIEFEYLYFNYSVTIENFISSFKILIDFMNENNIDFRGDHCRIISGREKIGFLEFRTGSIDIVLMNLDGQVEKYEFEFPLPKEKLI